MQQQPLNVLDTLPRVQGFLDAQAAALGTAVSPALRTRLNDVTTQLAAFQVEQHTATGAAQGETANQVTYRQQFFDDYMKPIARFAKGHLTNAPEFLVLTVASRKLGKGDFAGAAQALVDAAATYESQLVAGGMETDFLTQMRAALAQLNASRDARSRNLSRRAAATKGIKDSTKVANEVLVFLDSAISKALRGSGNTSLLADWKASSKVASAGTTLPPQPLGLPAANTTTAAGDSPTVVPPGTTTPAAPAPQTATPAV